MNIFYAVEANSIIEEVPELKSLILSHTNIFDYKESAFIYETEGDAAQAELILTEAGLFEDQFELIKIGVGEMRETFTDFGIMTNINVFLIKELICAFSITKGAKEAIQMASFQLDEHLVYKTVNEKASIYFVERHLKELVIGIAHAYDIEVSFFDLDK